MSDVISDIKAKLDIVDVVSAYVQLKKAGRNFKGLCPFHGEKSPSFVVSTEKQICHCFGCNKGGDMFSFIEEVEGVGFNEALELLADRAGVKLEKEKKAFDKENKSEKDDLFKAHDLACEFFEKKLWETNDGEKVLEYLTKRGVKEETIRDFRLGFAPDDYSELHPYLLKRGVSKKTLIVAGLVSAKNLADDQIYDKYRSRLIFPIFNYFGKVCGFGGRALKKDQMPKYLNSPENPIYNKSKILYGLYHGKQAVKEKDKVVLVEGYFDVIMPVQEGVKNIVATSGTALTKDQIVVIKRLTSNVVTCFDSDDAGFEATVRAYELLGSAGMVMKTVSGLGKKDPADYVLESGGAAFIEYVKKAEDFLMVYINKLVNAYAKNDVNAQRKVIELLLPYLKVVMPSLKDFYIRYLAKELDVPERSLYDEIDRFQLPKHHPANMQSVSEFDVNGQIVNFKTSTAELLMAILLEYPKLFKVAFEKLDEGDFEGEAKTIYKALNDQYNSSRVAPKEWSFDTMFPAEARGRADALAIYAEEKYSDFSDEVLKAELEKLIDRVKESRKTSRLDQLHKEITEAEEAQDGDKLRRLLEEHQKLLSQ